MKPAASTRSSNSMRTAGAPSGRVVATAIAFGIGSPAARASSQPQLELAYRISVDGTFVERALVGDTHTNDLTPAAPAAHYGAVVGAIPN